MAERLRGKQLGQPPPPLAEIERPDTGLRQGQDLPPWCLIFKSGE